MYILKEYIHMQVKCNVSLILTHKIRKRRLKKCKGQRVNLITHHSGYSDDLVFCPWQQYLGMGHQGLCPSRGRDGKLGGVWLNSLM
jgi:hypothetical protein